MSLVRGEQRLAVGLRIQGRELIAYASDLSP
jgi:hypothetical protein